MSWYTRTSLISSPSLFVLGEPGMGKSTAIRRLVLGLCGQGVVPLVLGDLKPDYAALVKALGGQVVTIGPGRDVINPLDVGPWREVLTRVSGRVADSVRANVIDRRLNMIIALATLIRGGPVTSDESTVLAAALRHLADYETTTPVLADVLAAIRAAPEAVRGVTLWTGADDREAFLTETAGLQRTLLALLNGALGDMFNGPTTTELDTTATAVCVDISAINESDELRTAAALLTTWSHGFALADAAHVLADANAAPKRTFFLVMDELWRALRVGHGLISRVDALTRLGRTRGVGTAFISHSLSDLQALPTEADRAKARGFADRCAVLLIGPSSAAELEAVTEVTPLSRAEITEVASWSAPESWHATGAVSAGRGNFLLKVGGRAGVPVHLAPTPAEQALGNTDFRWDMSGRVAP